MTDYSDAIDTWCTWLTHNHGRAHATVSKYRGHLLRFGAWVTSPPADPLLAPETTQDPLQPTLADLERFAGIYAHSLGLKARARRPMVSALRGFYSWASSSKLIASNPAGALPQPRAGRPLPKAMQLHDAERLLMQPDVTQLLGARDAAILVLFMGCGIRLRGLSSLNESQLVWYQEGQQETLFIRLVEKGDRERVLPVPREAAMLLRAYMGHEDLAKVPRTLPNGDRVLFVTTNNNNVPPHEYHGEARRISPVYIQQMMKMRAAKAGVPLDVAHPHALRHLFGAELSEEETPLLTMQALMGQVDPKATEIYSHIAVRRLRRTIEKAGPLAKMRGPLLDTLRSLDRAIGQAPRVSSAPIGMQKSKSAKRDRGGKSVNSGEGAA